MTLETSPRVALILVGALFTACNTPPATCESGSCSDAGLVINELVGSGGDFVELFNASDTAFDLTNHGLTDADDAGIRYATGLHFPSGATVAPRGFFTIFLESDCPSTVSPCVRGEFGLSQTKGDLVTLFGPTQDTVVQQTLPPNAATAGSSWARAFDGAGAFEVRTRTPGSPNGK